MGGGIGGAVLGGTTVHLITADGHLTNVVKASSKFGSI